MKNTPSIREIAKMCGTSTATVSRVMNGNCDHENPTHKRILEIIRETGYKRKKRILPEGNILCVSSPPSSNRNFQETHCYRFEKALEENSIPFNLRILTLHSNNERYIREFIKDQKIRGIIFNSAPIEKLSLPTVTLNQYPAYGEYPSVDCDDFSGLVMAFEHLRKNGHKKIAYFCDREEDISQPHPRRSNLPLVYKTAGLEYSKDLVIQGRFPSGGHAPLIKKGIDKILALPTPPTAIVLAGDCYAPAFYEMLRQRKLKIPEDISIVGFDDSSIASAMLPELTTVRQPFNEMSKETLRLLIEKIKGNSENPKKILVRPNLIIRNSTSQII